MHALTRIASLISRGSAAALVVAGVAALASSAHAQPLPVTQLAYSAKYLCGYSAAGPGGVITDFSLPYGCQEYTVIEVHNPHTIPVTVTVKVVQDSPTQAILVPPFNVVLDPNEAWDWNCAGSGGALFPAGAISRGFVEVLSPRQVKVVALYKEMCGGRGYIKSAAIAKKSSPPFIFGTLVRHSGTFLAGDHISSAGDTIRHETLISIANMSTVGVNANISFVNNTGLVHSFPKFLNPNGFYAVTEADLPLAVPRPFTGGVTVQYPSASSVALFECEEIIQKHVVGGVAAALMGMDVIEVQPIPRR